MELNGYDIKVLAAALNDRIDKVFAGDLPNQRPHVVANEADKRFEFQTFENLSRHAKGKLRCIYQNILKLSEDNATALTNIPECIFIDKNTNSAGLQNKHNSSLPFEHEFLEHAAAIKAITNITEEYIEAQKAPPLGFLAGNPESAFDPRKSDISYHCQYVHR
jgi:hypothetical protein